MRVAMVTRHSCIRVFKEGFALKQAGLDVDIISMVATFGFNAFDTFYMYNDRDMLKRSVEEAAGRADLFHVHNEPDWLVPVVRSATDKPIIYDVHDLDSFRWQREPYQDELDSFTMSNGWVHVSDACRVEAENLHGNTKANRTIPSYVNDVFYGPEPAGDVSWSSIVYEGGLASTSELPAHREEKGTNFRNYLPVVEAFTDQGYNFMLYSTMPITDGAYEQVGGVVLSSLPYVSMLTAIRPYAFGLVGAAINYPIMQAAMPNKLFEYISQGVVPVCYNAETAADFCEEHGIGIRLDGLDNLQEQLADGPACRERLLAKRHEWTMEKHINDIQDLYTEVL
jgi:hypothetical protein